MDRVAYDDHGRLIEHGNHIYRASRYSFDLTLTGWEPAAPAPARNRRGQPGSAIAQFAPYFVCVGRDQAAGAAAVAADEFVAGWFAVVLDDVDDVVRKGGA
jgi:hypothetical protein